MLTMCSHHANQAFRYEVQMMKIEKLAFDYAPELVQRQQIFRVRDNTEGEGYTITIPNIPSSSHCASVPTPGLLTDSLTPLRHRAGPSEPRHL